MGKAKIDLPGKPLDFGVPLQRIEVSFCIHPLRFNYSLVGENTNLLMLEGMLFEIAGSRTLERLKDRIAHLSHNISQCEVESFPPQS